MRGSTSSRQVGGCERSRAARLWRVALAGGPIPRARAQRGPRPRPPLIAPRALPTAPRPPAEPHPFAPAPPGRDILSSYPAAKSSAAGTGQGYLAYGSLSFNTAPAAIYSGSGAFSGPLADCGVANSSCPAASGGVCVVQSSARERQGADGAKSVVMPNACQLVQYCMENGAKGIVLVPPVEIPGFGAYPPDVSFGFVGAPRRPRERVLPCRRASACRASLRPPHPRQELPRSRPAPLSPHCALPPPPHRP